MVVLNVCEHNKITTIMYAYKMFLILHTFLIYYSHKHPDNNFSYNIYE